MTNEWKSVGGGVTAAKGFAAAGIHAGIKAVKTDMALILSRSPAVIAGTFTTNRIQAAPVRLCRERLSGGQATAIVVNSGSANACTGPQGRVDAEEMCRLTATALGVPERTVFCCSTGTIGKPLPMEKIASGIKLAAAALSEDGGDAAAHAIMTTDVVDKQAAVEFLIEGRSVRVGGMAKGAGMIEPNMATMLAFLTTDAAVAMPALQGCLSEAVRESFNRITVDGDQSTNDTCLFMANGAAGNSPLSPAHPEWPVFCRAVRHVARELALKIVKDGEGATRFVTVTVKGAASDADACKAVRAIANSLLVKTSWFGGDPNWGRLIDAVGYSGAEVIEDRVEIRYDGACAVLRGQQAPGFSLAELEKIIAQKCFAIDVDLHLGTGADTAYTCDCSLEYVRINSEYMT